MIVYVKVMAQQHEAEWCEPTSRYLHSTAVVGERLFLWAGNQEETPRTHDSAEKRAFLSRVEVFDLHRGGWEQQTTSGTPPLGVCGYASVAVDSNLHYFGGWCGHGDCRHNSVHKLSTSSLQWTVLAPTTTVGKVPMKKAHSGMVAFKDGGDNFLFVMGGRATISSLQPGVQYEHNDTNEQHMFSLSTCEWSLPTVTGQAPLPCSGFTLTPVGDKRAAMFGIIQRFECSHFLIVELGQNLVCWSNISKSVGRSLQWPEKRRGHAATCVSGPVLVMVGGWKSGEYPLDEFWICNSTTMLWKKLPLPESIIKRCYHSVSTFQLGPQCVWLVVFGGWRKLYDEAIVCTAIVELVQGGDGKWSVGMFMEGAALADRKEYQDKLAEARRKGLQAAAAARNGTMAEQKRQQVQQLQEEKRQDQQHLEEAKQSLQQMQQQSQQQERCRELEQEKQLLQQQLKQVQGVAQQAHQELDQAHHELQKTRHELQAAITKAQESQQQVQQLRQQLAALSSEDWYEQPHWVVRREEVVMTSKVVGRGGWGEVKVAKFRGLQVAAKCLYQVILSPYNLRQFTREMTIAGKLRHPNLLLFIGATQEGEPVILTELMPTSLRKELEKGELTERDIVSISQDVACGLCYLHQWKPHPIVHRDISSGNVLLEPLPNGWRAKVSDFGSANFMNLVSTISPGCPTYAAPEVSLPHQHSPKMDVFSFGVLMVEMCLRELPESSPEQQEAQIQRIEWPAMLSLVGRCISKRPADRPSMRDIMKLLSRM